MKNWQHGVPAHCRPSLIDRGSDEELMGLAEPLFYCLPCNPSVAAKAAGASIQDINKIFNGTKKINAEQRCKLKLLLGIDWNEYFGYMPYEPLLLGNNKYKRTKDAMVILADYEYIEVIRLRPKRQILIGEFYAVSKPESPLETLSAIFFVRHQFKSNYENLVDKASINLREVEIDSDTLIDIINCFEIAKKNPVENIPLMRAVENLLYHQSLLK